MTADLMSAPALASPGLALAFSTPAAKRRHLIPSRSVPASLARPTRNFPLRRCYAALPQV
jgi:hypothetical protein